MTLTHPVAAVVAAFLSHFMLDALPHFGASVEREKKLLVRVWLVDFLLLCIGCASLVVLDVPNKPLVTIASLAAMSPDFAWVYRYVVKQKFGALPATKLRGLNAFHAKIQWSETHMGMVLELVWFAATAVVVLRQIGGL